MIFNKWILQLLLHWNQRYIWKGDGKSVNHQADKANPDLWKDENVYNEDSIRDQFIMLLLSKNVFIFNLS